MIQEPKDNWKTVPRATVKAIHKRLLEAGLNLSEVAGNVGFTPRHLELCFEGAVELKAYTLYLLELILAHPKGLPKVYDPEATFRGKKVEVEDEDEF